MMVVVGWGKKGGWGGGDCLLLFIFDPYHLLLL